ncbi:M57 family metalloprotease [Aquimarina hainanensis]|uniref:M57 family metalloprotease n=1 Tax=Aquimarina hainanensis TaxID=1578017 RepID=A0ABW5NCQ6_9FLAO|nr:M57 family metalloprotease [Aquimarina sp. TRL1]QKX06397.1 peptidase [Aquimarina sp. TRL1]
MKRIKYLAICTLLVGSVISCQKNDVAEEIQDEKEEVSKEQLLKLAAMGVNTDDVTVVKRTFLDGVTQSFLKNDTDLLFSYDLSSYDDLGQNKQGNKHYRTRNLISNFNRTIDILGYTGNGNALTGKMRTALQWAVNNYNSLNTSLHFRLTFGTNYQAADMVVYNNNLPNLGGEAGFPEGGRAFKWIQLNQGNESYPTNFIEHVITHEIGHCIGLRHTDYFNRVCNGVNEGDGGIGAIHIPGTPNYIDITSIMISCPPPGTDPNTYSGEFTANDVRAIQYLY